jgi:hypothetical protein
VPLLRTTPGMGRLPHTPGRGTPHHPYTPRPGHHPPHANPVEQHAAPALTHRQRGTGHGQVPTPIRPPLAPSQSRDVQGLRHHMPPMRARRRNRCGSPRTHQSQPEPTGRPAPPASSPWCRRLPYLRAGMQPNARQPSTNSKAPNLSRLVTQRPSAIRTLILLLGHNGDPAPSLPFLSPHFYRAARGCR